MKTCGVKILLKMLNKKQQIPLEKGQKMLADVIPLKGVYDDYYQRKDGAFIAVLRVNPVNVALLSRDAAIRAIQKIERALTTISGRIGILIANQWIKSDEYVKHLKSIEAETDIDDHLEELESLRERVARGKGSADAKVPLFYVIIEDKSKNETVAAKRLRDQLNQVSQVLSSGGFSSAVVEKQEFLTHLYERMNPLSAVSANIDFTDLREIMPTYIYDFDTHFVMDDRFYKVVTVTGYPTKMDHPGWLSDLYASQNVDAMSITLNPADKFTYLKSLSKSMNTIREKMNNKKIPDYQRVKLKNELDDAEFMMTEMSGENVSMYMATVLMMVSGNSLEELNEHYRDLLAHLRSIHTSGGVVSWYSLAPIWYMFPFLYESELEQYERWNMGSNVIGSMVPFNLPSYSESTGLPMAINMKTDELVIVDRFNRKRHPNGNMFIGGATGAGKSFFMTTEMLREAAEGDQVIAIDPEREYTRFKNANRIVFSLGSKDVINPFHIRSAIVDTEEGMKDIVNLGQYLRVKIAENMTFFKSIYPQMSNKQSAILLQAQKECYARYDINFDSKELIEGQLFPTFSTLDEVLREMESAEAKDLVDVFEPFVDGAYSGLFNGQTNVAFHDSITVLDVHDLSEEIKTPMMGLLIRDVWELIKLNRTKQRRISFYVDEIGLLSADNAVQTLRFLMTLAKRIRKYFGNLTTATQNAEDVFADSVRRYGAALVKNARFRLLLQLSRDDLTQLRQVIELSDAEIESLVKTDDDVDKSEKGKGILSIGSFKLQIRTFATKVELRTVDPKQYEELYGLVS